MTRQDKWKQRDCVVKYRALKDAIRAAAIEAGFKNVDANSVISLSWVAYFAPAKDWSKKRRKEAIGNLHRHKPDRDNIDKAILDALFTDDSGIASGTIEKRWCERSRIEITIEVTA